MAKKILLKGKIKTTLNKEHFRKFVIDSVVGRINEKMVAVSKDFRKFVRQLIYEIIVGSVDAKHIQAHGIAAYELGLRPEDSKKFVSAIADKVAKSARITIPKIKRVGNDIKGKIGIFMLKSDYADILALPEAVNVTEKGDELPILFWIMYMGNDLIKLRINWEDKKKDYRIKGYRVAFESGKGRSRGAIMKPTRNQAELFRINPLYKGTEDDNWLTRALEEKAQYFKEQVGIYLNSKVFT